MADWRRLAMIGPHPVRLTRTVSFLALRRARMRALRGRYASLAQGAADGVELRAPAIDLGQAGDLPEALLAAAAALREEAEMVLAHTFDYLGSGPVALGERIDWHVDFKSGYRWEPAFYLDVQVTRLDDGSDAKVPWELSRGHQLLTLARAAVLFREERFAAELEAQLASWIDANPPGCGINWVTPMEVGIRAVNWLWAIGTLEQWRPLDPALRTRVTDALHAHGAHVHANLEGTPYLRTNHYLGNVLGLLATGCALAGDPRADRWRAYALRAFEREIARQTFADGADFESSLPYHGLKLEIYMLAWVIAGWAGAPLSSRYRERLSRMLEFSAAVRQPGGRTPAIGDQDSGRTLPGGFARPCTQDNLLWLGAAILAGARPLDGPPDPEVAWTLGVDAWRAAAALTGPPPRPRDAFPESGWYVLRRGGAHVVIRAGDLRQSGSGGHAHNDLLSYELTLDGVPLIVDPGTFLYTADIGARHHFRRTAAHNVLAVDGLELNPVRERDVFTLRQHAFAQLVEWAHGERFIAEHDGWRELSVTHRRALSLEETGERFEVRDELGGEGTHALTSHLHLAAGATVVECSPAVARVALGRREWLIVFDGFDAVDVAEDWVSESYGRRRPSLTLLARARVALPVSVGYAVSSAR